MKYKIRFADKEDYKVINEIIREVHDLHVENRQDVYNETDKPLSEEEFKSVNKKENNVKFELKVIDLFK